MKDKTVFSCKKIGCRVSFRWAMQLAQHEEMQLNIAM